WLLRVFVCLVPLLSCAGPRPVEPMPENASFLAPAQEQTAAREYRASENGEGLQAPNRAHNLRTYFEKTGIRVHDRTMGGSPKLLQLMLSGSRRGTPVPGWRRRA